jgi:hypothetical protein
MKNEPIKTGWSATAPNHLASGPTAAAGSKNNLTVLHRLPQRYVIKDADEKRMLTCLEAPTISVQVEAGLTVSASAAHRSSPGTIYLDGVAQDAPFMDIEKQIYNFDHHEGCLRPFTLSTCEQVLVMILKGLDLRGRDWKVFANEPDLDTVLAIWLLFNHQRVNQKNSDGLRRLYALVRLEGIIDAHGLEMTALSAFPSDLLTKTEKLIDYLRAEEIELKKNGNWEKKDDLQYIALILHKIDRITYKSHDFSDFKALKELARSEIGDHRLAVVIEAELGIYELEPYLNRIYGESLGLVILKKGEGLYTLRRLDPFMPLALNNVYQKLNAIDPDVSCNKNGCKWGGSDDIGGSPRGMATKLTPQEIVQACRDAFQKTGFIGHMIHFFHALMIVAAILGAAEICKFYFSANFSSDAAARTNLLFVSDLSFFAALAFFAALSLAIVCRTRWWRFGIRMPTGKDWWFLLPIIALAAFAQGAYVPRGFFPRRGPDQSLIYLILTIPLALELLFRSLAHGILAKDAAIQNCRSRWFLSYPAAASAVLYAAFIAYLALLPDILHGALQMTVAAKCLFAAIAFGTAAAMVRERSQSVFPVMLLHVAVITVFVFWNSI